MSDDSCRISVEISDELKRAVIKYLRYGEQKLLITIFLTNLMDACEKLGNRIPVDAYISGCLSAEEIAKAYRNKPNQIEMPDFSIHGTRGIADGNSSKAE